MRHFFLLLLATIIAGNTVAQPTAKEWNDNVVGWNLGNQFECAAPGQDGESMAIGNQDNADKAETAWGNPTVTKKTIKAIKAADVETLSAVVPRSAAEAVYRHFHENAQEKST